MRESWLPVTVAAAMTSEGESVSSEGDSNGDSGEGEIDTLTDIWCRHQGEASIGSIKHISNVGGKVL